MHAPGTLSVPSRTSPAANLQLVRQLIHLPLNGTQLVPVRGHPRLHCLVARWQGGVQLLLLGLRQIGRERDRAAVGGRLSQRPAARSQLLLLGLRQIDRERGTQPLRPPQPSNCKATPWCIAVRYSPQSPLLNSFAVNAMAEREAEILTAISCSLARMMDQAATRSSARWCLDQASTSASTEAVGGSLGTGLRCKRSVGAPNTAPASRQEKHIVPCSCAISCSLASSSPPSRSMAAASSCRRAVATKGCQGGLTK